MNLNRPFLSLVFLLLAAVAFGQKKADITEELIPLHAPQGELVHFRQNGYVLSFSKQDLLELYGNNDWAVYCSDVLSTTDTLNLDSTLYTLTEIAWTNHRGADSYHRGRLKYFGEGRLQVYCVATGKNLARIKIVKDYSQSGMLMVPWSFRDPANDQEFHYYVQTWNGCPSF